MTQPIAIVATIATRTEYRSSIEVALLTAVAATREEPGCEQYTLHRLPADPNTFVMIERWRDQESLDHHAGAHAFAILATALDGKATLDVMRYLPIP
jgi:quinol monooxygenase YgiN